MVVVGVKVVIGSKSINSLFNRLGRLEGSKNSTISDETNSSVPYATAEELEQMTDKERFEAWFNWHVKVEMPYYKAYVIQYHNISEEEYDRRTLEGDQSIYLPQPNNKFEGTLYMERVAHVLGLSYQELQDKFNRGELKQRIACGPHNPETGGWCDENPVVF